jgi:glycine cleavage system H lipoate-binding protein
MTKEIHRSANGKKVDMGSLRLRNEHVRAVGNMKVNARGDLIDENNQVISSKPEQVNQAYNNQVTNPRKNK